MMNSYIELVSEIFANYGFSEEVNFMQSHDKEYITNFEYELKLDLEKAKKELEKTQEISEFTKKTVKKNKPFTIGSKGYVSYQIKDIEHDIRNIIVEGQVFATEVFQTRKGMNILTIKMTDFTDSITLKAFESKYFTVEQMKAIKAGI